MTEVRGLCLDSTATQLPEGTALASTSDTSRMASELPAYRAIRQVARPCPPWPNHLRARSVVLDREHFTHARRSCVEPGECSVGKIRGRTVSLWRTRVPKPTWSIARTDVPVQRPFLPLSEDRGLLAAQVEVTYQCRRSCLRL